jgi:hypothetical protein
MTYDIPIHIVVDTNTDVTIQFADNDFHNEIESGSIEFCVHKNLEHPSHLTWMHRNHIRDNISQYDVFMYTEDDMDVPFKNFLDYLSKFWDLWPYYVPSFVRIEKNDNGELYNTDNEKVNLITKEKIIKIQGKSFVALESSYHAFWILPKEILEQYLYIFNRVSSSQEMAASFDWYDLDKTGLVELTNDYKVSNVCYSYHLPNTYVNNSSFGYGKIKMDELIQIV